jgi:xanthine dehydrogenase accessory factor
LLNGYSVIAGELIMGSQSTLVKSALVSAVTPAAEAGFRDYVIAELLRWRDQGLSVALVTLVNVEGSSPRPVGSQLAVNEIGESVGLISGGCVEAALIMEAKNCIAQRQQRLIRYGKDSDYIDVKLPCGSGIDVLIQPITSEAANENDNGIWLQQIQTYQQQRQPCLWQTRIVQNQSSHSVNPVNRSEASAQPIKSQQLGRREMETEFTQFAKLFLPKPRVVVIGDGPVFDGFLAVAGLMDYDLHSYTTRLHSRSSYKTIQPSHKDIDYNTLDEYTALIVLSHDHEIEVPILALALQKKPVLIAALGSRSTHNQRLTHLREYLSQHGQPQDLADRVKGPAGIDLGPCSTPPEIAISILAQCISHFHFQINTPQ